MTEHAGAAILVDPADGAVPAAASFRVRWLTPWRMFTALGVALIATAAVLSAVHVEPLDGDTLSSLASAVASETVQLRWQYVAIVVGLAALHYLATAVSLRAAATVDLPLAETYLVQLAASAANRITPVGLGGAAVNVRYLTRRGTDTTSAVGAIAAVTVLGGAAEAIVLTGLILGGRWLGMDGAGHQLRVLIGSVTSGVAPWVWTGIAIVAVAVLLVGRRWRTHGFWQRAAGLVVPTRCLLRRPRDLAALLVSSGLTTVILGFAFIATTAMVPGPSPDAGIGALLVAFMIGSAAGGSVPVPAGLGTTEAALSVVLISLDVPAGQALHEVLIFRILTFWVPAIIGVIGSRVLYRRGAL